jgi:ferric-dicitrate binding protein FerR (iron transport regulator)
MRENGDILFRYIEGLANAEEKAAVLAWLNESDEHKAEFIQLRMFYLKKREVELSSAARIKQAEFEFALRLERKKREKRKSTFRRIPLSVASAAAIALGAFFIWNINTPKTQPYFKQVASVVAHEKFVSVYASNGVKMVTLPDGTHVWLNKHSSIRYSTKIDPHLRQVAIKGEAYFDVVKNKHCPFIVSAGNVFIRVLGTRFNVRSSKSMNWVEAVLLSGRIELLNHQKKTLATLRPSTRAVVDDGNLSIQKNVDAEDYITWIKGLRILQDQTIEEVAKYLKSKYRVDVVLTEDSVMSGRYRCVIQQGQKLSDITRMLEYIAPIKCRISNDTLFIKSNH